MEENKLKEYVNLMKTRFLEDPGVLFQIGGLDRAEALFSLQCEAQIQAFDRQNAVQLLEDDKGFLIGFFSELLPFDKFIETLQEASSKLIEAATDEELLYIQNNALLSNEVTPLDWHNQYISGNVFHLLTVVVDKSLKGTGALRKLIMPVIADCEARKIPIVLETHNPDNVPLYEHFGFQLMESHVSEKIDLKCFCMMKQ